MTSAATQELQSRPNNKPQIIKVGRQTYVAANYDASFLTMLEGEDGIVLVDTGATPQIAAMIMDDLRKISQKPLKAIIFTHSHPDHTGGAAGVIGMELAARPDAEIEIWARDNYGSEFGLAALLPQAFNLRGGRQFGEGVPAQWKYPPLGPRELARPDKERPIAAAPVRPNRFFSGKLHCLEVAGLKLELHAAPGETSDQLFIWKEDEKIAFAGDNIYGSFPNLYAVRGSGYRDVAMWADSVGKIRDKKPAFLVMGHSEPLLKAEECEEWLSSYYEAIKYVFDATISGMNQGLTADELAESVRLPEHLAAKDFLTEYYGNVPWSVRSIFSGHLGWFDGDPRKLAPLTLRAEAERMADMAGGAEALLVRAASALAAGDLDGAAWAAQLVSYALRLSLSEAQLGEARRINADALERLGEATLSTSGRNYLLSSAQDFRK